MRSRRLSTVLGAVHRPKAGQFARSRKNVSDFDAVRWLSGRKRRFAKPNRMVSGSAETDHNSRFPGQYPSIAVLSRVSRCVVSRHDHCTICCTGRRNCATGIIGASGTHLSLARLSLRSPDVLAGLAVTATGASYQGEDIRAANPRNTPQTTVVSRRPENLKDRGNEWWAHQGSNLGPAD